jgi:hypothetical protein
MKSERVLNVIEKKHSIESALHRGQRGQSQGQTSTAEKAGTCTACEKRKSSHACAGKTIGKNGKQALSSAKRKAF